MVPLIGRLTMEVCQFVQGDVKWGDYRTMLIKGMPYKDLINP
jgi:hypothetical protein